MDFTALEAVVRLTDPCLCESHVGTFTVECVRELLELKGQRLPLQELWVVFDGSGALDQTALAIEHVRWAAPGEAALEPKPGPRAVVCPRAPDSALKL